MSVGILLSDKLLTALMFCDQEIEKKEKKILKRYQNCQKLLFLFKRSKQDTSVRPEALLMAFATGYETKPFLFFLFVNTYISCLFSKQHLPVLYTTLSKADFWG